MQKYWLSFQHWILRIKLSPRNLKIKVNFLFHFIKNYGGNPVPLKDIHIHMYLFCVHRCRKPVAAADIIWMQQGVFNKLADTLLIVRMNNILQYFRCFCKSDEQKYVWGNFSRIRPFFMPKFECDLLGTSWKWLYIFKYASNPANKMTPLQVERWKLSF